MSRQSPILFPIVVRLKDQEYIYKDSIYKLLQHAFVRYANFKVVVRTEKGIILELVAANESKKTYPFDFLLQL